MNPGQNGFYPQNAFFPQNFYQPNNYDNSQSTAQSQSHSHGNSPFGSQNADALAAAQGKTTLLFNILLLYMLMLFWYSSAFQTNGPFGSFGATSNNANTQTLDIGANGGANVCCFHFMI